MRGMHAERGANEGEQDHMGEQLTPHCLFLLGVDDVAVERMRTVRATPIAVHWFRRVR
jgi:hypothetical protein